MGRGWQDIDDRVKGKEEKKVNELVMKKTPSLNHPRGSFSLIYKKKKNCYDLVFDLSVISFLSPGKTEER